ncbi:hypothetical protein TIFTF001_000399 [Ficus carica]|uniref:non-specific serine/threonine protein kinase n=1 Tax=Ficus carica TaxID=3494 RepID=A0AA88CNZ5_FICCA|nr:hypothetical protein TIFTF001_000399 [Ficus carica]
MAIPNHIVTTLCLSLFLTFSFGQDEGQFVYNGFHGANLQLGGSAKILPNGLLQLTNTLKHRLGHALYKVPMSFKTPSSGFVSNLSFSTSFVFSMVPELPNSGGHGLAFTISPSMDFSQAVPSQYFGIFNISNNGLPTNHVLAIELDTVLSPEFKDEDANHVGIDVDGLISVASAPASYYSGEEKKNIRLELISGNPLQLWVDYDEEKKRLDVTLAPTRSFKPDRPLLSTSIDLSRVLVEHMYVGFSSSTGTLASDHYILGWSFNRSGQAQSLDIAKLPSLPSRKKSRQYAGKIVMLSSAGGAIFLVVVIAGATYTTRKKRYEEVREEWETIYGPQRFSYKNLYKATKGFKESEVLGEGGFGKVYRGTLASTDAQIAVKKVSHNSKQGMKAFVTEISAMGRLRHRNLVQLIGYCRRKGELLLVYDFMPNGSLDRFLFSAEKPSLNWAQRFRILRDVSSALLYLHEGWEQVVLHRDVKASNVLLDADLKGRLGDFGLARLCDHGTNPQTTQVAGTVGYLAPELSRTGKATTSSDVFAFGVFMLEVACGRTPIEPQGPPEEVDLVDWVLECWKVGAILDASDPKLEGDFLADEMELVLKLGLLCSRSLPAKRPTMRQLTQYLDGKATTDLPEIQVFLGAYF